MSAIDFDITDEQLDLFETVEEPLFTVDHFRMAHDVRYRAAVRERFIACNADHRLTPGHVLFIHEPDAACCRFESTLRSIARIFKIPKPAYLRRPTDED